MLGPAKLRYTDALGNTLDFLSDPVVLVNHLGFEGPQPQHRVIEAPLRDGSRYLNTRYRELFLTIQFELEGADYANLMARRRQIIPILAPKRGLGVLQYQAAVGSEEYHIDALVERRAHASNDPFRMAVERWTVQFRCPTPFWRSSAAIERQIVQVDAGMNVPTSVPTSIPGTAGTSIISNGGDVATYPVIRLSPASGAVVSPTITNQTTGASLSLAGLRVDIGEELVIDMLNQRVTLDGSSVLSTLTATSQFWALEVGLNEVRVTSTSGTETWTVEHYELFEGV